MNKRTGALHITQKVDYGVTLLSNLTKTETPSSVRKIAEKHHLSFSFLQKVARELQKAGLIKATRGSKGGYMLTKPGKDVSLKEIIEALEGPIAIVPCLKNGANCNHESNCRIQAGFAKINQELLDYFSITNLNHFA